jgi:hypothetical protein
MISPLLFPLAPYGSTFLIIFEGARGAYKIVVRWRAIRIVEVEEKIPLIHPV